MDQANGISSALACARPVIYLLAARQTILRYVKTGGKNVKLKRALTALGVAVAAGVVPMVMAVPAQADQVDCVNYLSSKGYTIGSGVRTACSYDTWATKPFCEAKLASLGITNTSHIIEACNRANN
ncbi:hypothetical protein [Streptomyces sp. NPDC017991]|uniref:hypothetical protein n=1 Tax=Streptomyces sp. NPDC017991 TaxID=3365026 RepID=UPI00378CEBF3